MRVVKEGVGESSVQKRKIKWRRCAGRSRKSWRNIMQRGGEEEGVRGRSGNQEKVVEEEEEEQGVWYSRR